MFHRSIFCQYSSFSNSKSVSAFVGVVAIRISPRKNPNLSILPCLPFTCCSARLDRSFPDPKPGCVTFFLAEKLKRKQSVVVVDLCCCSALGNFFSDRFRLSLSPCVCVPSLSSRFVFGSFASASSDPQHAQSLGSVVTLN